MILSCPKCSTRYMMSAASIGPQGRDVRCAKCDHQWFQEPEEIEDDALSALPVQEEEDQVEEYADDEEEINVEDRLKDIASQLMEEDEEEAEQAEDQLDNVEGTLSAVEESEPDQHQEDNIPNAVKPRQDDDRQDDDREEEKAQKPIIVKIVPLQAKLIGYAASIVLFALIFGSALLFKNTIVQVWPPSIAVYELTGFNVAFKGEELVMETLSAEAIPQADGSESLVLKGRVVNLTDASLEVPKMIAVLRNTDGDAGATWLIDAPVDQVEAGASFVFTSEYAGLPSGTGAVNLTFAPEISD